MEMHESGEMYLETIYVLSQKNPVVRGIDICTHMGFSKPSVSRAIGLLKNDGYITTDDQKYIRLTDAGEKIAKRIYERHTLLTKLFMNIGVDEETATEDACKIEHYLSDKTFEAIKTYAKKCK